MLRNLALVATFFLALIGQASYGEEERTITLKQFIESGHEVSEPLSVAEVERASLAEIEQSSTASPKVPFGDQNAAWMEFKASMKEGDVVLRFKSAKWRPLSGMRGLILVRDGVVIRYILEAIS